MIPIRKVEGKGAIFVYVYRSWELNGVVLFGFELFSEVVRLLIVIIMRITLCGDER